MKKYMWNGLWTTLKSQFIILYKLGTIVHQYGAKQIYQIFVKVSRISTKLVQGFTGYVANNIYDLVYNRVLLWANSTENSNNPTIYSASLTRRIFTESAKRFVRYKGNSIYDLTEIKFYYGPIWLTTGNAITSLNKIC
jgi:hypothetical protein